MITHNSFKLTSDHFSGLTVDGGTVAVVGVVKRLTCDSSVMVRVETKFEKLDNFAGAETVGFFVEHGSFGKNKLLTVLLERDDPSAFKDIKFSPCYGTPCTKELAIQIGRQLQREVVGV